jgi:hypothetical protein
VRLLVVVTIVVVVDVLFAGGFFTGLSLLGII